LNVEPIQTSLFNEGDDLFRFITKHVGELPEGSILVVTSKIVALAEGRTALVEEREKYVKSESTWCKRSNYGYLTITQGLFMPSAGIDESNANGNIILLPKDSMASAQKLQKKLQQQYRRKNIGVLITDSRTYPLRVGVTGVALGHAGFDGVRDYRGKKDLFGRPFAFEQSNVADALAASAVLTMGEGAEQQPLALITKAPVSFSDDPAAALSISVEEDLYFSRLN